ncbi:Aldolase-type TIM barrel [Cordyceps fumosorosea ARSEF 2679]|uniref:Aldolase-type TIM barrel n=1 Tax=Cordyceps fumosorosea (strain ARSEF 2679) TaxID=1081104 RepID=A0A167SZ24_CORFA|nr:Aldolase-type TIM barrel [Cordyceps fumosorosea ARSEF 2679]OAA60077.1 Aldolase-type TIM barrel [Cordyceps fumosorosea ARSEF 2679]
MAKETLQISNPVTLPCGLTLPNRLVKAALAEGWASRDRRPHEDLIDTYRLWAEGDWGLLITGNVQVDSTYLGTPEDVSLNERLSRAAHVESWGRWAAAASERGTPALVQINHPGRQSTIGAGTKGLFGKSIAPSAVGVRLGSGCVASAASALVFGTPRAMTDLEIDDVVRRFATAAKISEEAGFAGVEIHAAHGYLLSQFLSAKSNRREDGYGGSPKNRARIVVEVIRAVRAAVSPKFCVGIKINSVDHQSPGELKDCLEQLTEITNAGVDFLEISGGNYENPLMMASVVSEAGVKVSASTATREAFFLDFASAIRKTFPGLLLMVTGGFRSRLGLEYAVKSGACDLTGIGRPSVLEPRLPRSIIFNADVSDEDARLPTKSFSQATLSRWLGIKGLGGGTETLGYLGEIHRMQKVAAAYAV